MENLKDVTMETYTEMKKRHSDEISNFQGLFWAFSKEQLKEGFVKLGLNFDTDKSKVCSIGGGGFILKEKLTDFNNIFKRIKEEKRNLKKEEKQLIEALVYELGNYEYCITGDVRDTLESLNLTIEEVNPETLKKAVQIYNKQSEEANNQ